MLELDKLLYLCGMRKTLMTFILVICTLFSFSQEISIATSEKISFGEKNMYTGKFDFPEFQSISQVVILIDGAKITVDSKVRQEYYIEGDSYEFEKTKGSYWYAYDITGTKCRVYLYMDEYSDLFFAVEYNDYAWIYSIKPVK